MADPAPAAAARPPVRKVQLHHTNPQALSTITNLSNESPPHANVAPNVELALDGFRFELGSELFTTLCTRVSSRTLVLNQCNMADPALNEQGAHALATSVKAKTLKITYCANGFSTALLRNLINNTSVADLSLQVYPLDDTVSATICQLLETSTTLRGFELGPKHSSSTLRLATHQNFEALLGAIAKSKLECFSVGLLPFRAHLRSLTNTIASLRIHKLSISVSALSQFDSEKEDMLRAIKRNFYLRSVVGSIRSGTREAVRPGDDHSRYPRRIFDQDDDQRKLAFYLSRNNKLHRWADNGPANPLQHEDHLVPRALGVAAEAGNDMLYRSLRSHLGNYLSNVTLRKSKRKRPRVGQFSPHSW